MTATLKEQAKAHTPAHGSTTYREYLILYPMGRFFVYKDDQMVWSDESLTAVKNWIDQQLA